MGMRIKTRVDAERKENVMVGNSLDLRSGLIRILRETGLSVKSVLDFVCNQGSLPKTLYKSYPFKKASQPIV